MRDAKKRANEAKKEDLCPMEKKLLFEYEVDRFNRRSRQKGFARR